MKDLDWLISKRLFSLYFLLVFFLPDLVSQKTAGKNSCSISAQLQISVAYFCSIGLYFLV